MSRLRHDEAYDGIALLKRLSRRAMEYCPPYMQREDFIHAGWLAMATARRSGKGWGYAKIAAWGAMMNELSRWLGIPPKGVGRLVFVPFDDRRDHQAVDLPPRPTPELPPSVVERIPRLPKRQRECLELYAQGFTLTEIGVMFSISPSNVQTHLHAGCDTLRRLLAAEVPGESFTEFVA